MFSNFYSENRVVYEKMSKNVIKSETPHSTWRMRVACSISKATRAQAHAHAPAPTHARTHAHTEICGTYCFYTATVVS
jgi:hypothetical protein